MQEETWFNIRKWLIVVITGLSVIGLGMAILMVLILQEKLLEFFSSESEIGNGPMFYMVLLFIFIILVMGLGLALNAVGLYGVLKDNHRYVHIYCIGIGVAFIFNIMFQLYMESSISIIKSLILLAYVLCVVTYERDLHQFRPDGYVA